MAIKELSEAIKTMKKMMEEKGMEIFRQEFQTIFDNYPELKAFKFTTYTMYFNDGDECHFRVHEPEILWFGEEDYQSEWDFPKKDNVYFARIKCCEDIETLLVTELIEIVFGDHIEVTVTRDNITVDSYTDHD